jgi:sugar diacid utilization regulator
VAETDPTVGAAAEAMLGDLGPLVEYVTAQVWHRAPGYRAVLMDSNELRSYLSSNLFTVLSCMVAGRTVTIAEYDRARHLGDSRALQGVPLDALVQSFRTAERVMVDQFCLFHARVGGSLPGQRQGIQQITAVLDTLEETLVEAYRSTQRRIALHYESAMGDLVTQIALGQGVATEDVDRLATLLDVDPGKPYRAAAARVAHDADPGVLGQVRHHVTSRLRESAQGPVLTGTWRNTLLFLVPVATGGDRLAEVLTRALSSAQCRYEVIVGIGAATDRLTDAGPSCRQAMDALEIALRTGRSRQAVDYDDVLIDLLLARDRNLISHLVRRGLGGLLDQPQLVETLRAFLDHGQAASDTARALNVHNNTVTYRLRRIRELTGYDLRKLDDVLLLGLALRANDLLTCRP